MKVRKMLVPAYNRGLKCPHAMSPNTITIHNTANDASANNEVSYMRSNSSAVGFHYAVDDREVVQGIPSNRNAWHAGDGHGGGNRKSLSVEICYSLSGGSRFTKAEKKAAKFVAQLLRERGWGVDRLRYHYQWSETECPHRTDAGTFTNMVSAELNPPKPKIEYEDIGVKKVELRRNANLWNFDFTKWANAKSVGGTYPKGHPVYAVAIATNSLGGEYYMTDHSYNEGDINATHGFNVKDAKDYVEPKPTPEPEPEPTPDPEEPGEGIEEPQEPSEPENGNDTPDKPKSLLQNAIQALKPLWEYLKKLWNAKY